MDGHRASYIANYADGTTRVECSCGWYRTAERDQNTREIHMAHLEQARRPALAISDLFVGEFPRDMTPAEAQAHVNELAVRRFERETDPVNCSVLDALEAAKQYIIEKREKGENIDHVIVFTGRAYDGGSSETRYFQAGNYSAHAQLGLCHAGTEMLWAD